MEEQCPLVGNRTWGRWVWGGESLSNHTAWDPRAGGPPPKQREKATKLTGDPDPAPPPSLGEISLLVCAQRQNAGPENKDILIFRLTPCCQVMLGKCCL